MSKWVTIIMSIIIILMLSTRIISNTAVKPLVVDQMATHEESTHNVQTPSESTLIEEAFTIESFNKLSKQELMRFPGIGEVTSQAILDYIDTNGPFESFEDLIQVKGIGVKKLEKILSNLP